MTDVDLTHLYKKNRMHKYAIRSVNGLCLSCFSSTQVGCVSQFSMMNIDGHELVELCPYSSESVVIRVVGTLELETNWVCKTQRKEIS